MKDINELDLKEKIGQLFIVGINGKTIDEKVKKLITEYKVGGIILYRKNYSTYAEMIKIVNELKQLNSVNKIPLLISIDQEGGRVNRMPSEFINLKPAKKLASKKYVKIVKESGKIIGKMLKETGIDMNFAPVADIQNFPDNHPLGDRCFSDNAKDVTNFAIEFIEGLEEEKVIPVVKHFPGHGATSRDSHYLLPVIKKSIEESSENLIPFENIIKHGIDCVLVGHLLYKQIDKKYPVSLSKKFITKYLRKKCRFNGLVISDDIKMKAVDLFYGPVRAATKAIEAGNDIVIMRVSYDSKIKIINKITKMVKKGKYPEYKINKKVRRILKLKEKYNVNDKKVQGCNIEEINKQIKYINDFVSN